MCVSAAEEYAKWYEDHKEKKDCQQNYTGSFNGIQKDAAKILWQRSVSERKIRYTEILLDGDAKKSILT